MDPNTNIITRTTEAFEHGNQNTFPNTFASSCIENEEYKIYKYHRSGIRISKIYPGVGLGGLCQSLAGTQPQNQNRVGGQAT